MHQNAILLSSDQATILKKDQCSSITTTRIARIESPPPLSSASPQVLNQATLGEQHTTRIKSNNEFKPTDCQRGRLDDAVCKDDGQQHHEQRSYEIRPFVSEATDENEDKVAVRLREPAQASKAALEPNNQDQQHHNQHLSLNHNNHNHNHHHHHNQHHQQQQQLFSLARLNPIKMEMTQTTTNQEQLASSQKQQQQKHQAQHRAAHQESLMDLLDTNSSQNQGQQQQPPSSAPTTGANNNEMISPVQNGPSTTGVVVDSISDQKASAFCAGCQAQIRDKFIFSVIDLFWHQDCVQCADCSLKLNDRCYTLNGKLYCKHDYWHRYGPKCFACQQSIEQSELVQRIKGNRVYHLKCFACHECRRPLEQGEQLHLMGDKRLLCKQDFQRLNNGCRLSASSCASGAGGGTGDGSGDASGDGGSGNGNANSGGQTKQDPNNGSGNGGSSSGNNNNNNGSVSYLTLLGSGSVKSAQGAASGAQKVSTGQQQKRSSLTSLDNTCAMSETLGQAGDVDSSACQTGETDLEPAELAGADDDDQTTFEEDEDGLVGPRRQQQQQRRREPLAGLDAEMLNDDDQSTGQFNEDENEENQLSRQHQAHMGTNVEHQQQLDELQAANSGCVKPIKQQQQQQGQQKNLLNPILPNGGIRKRRRRKQRLSIAGDKQQQQQAKSGNKLTSSGRNGESILNGSATSSQQQPASSILAGMQSATLDLDGASKQQQQLKSSCSTISSSSSSTSSSSNHSLSNSSTVTNHHHDQHYQQQHQQQQSASGATHRLATSSGLHHAHHHATLGATGNQQQQHQSGHHQSTGGSGGHKPTRVRTVLNEKQLQTLRDCYAQNPRPDALMKEQLVDMTGLSPRVIRVWFQNKRCKDKKKSILYKQMQQHEKDGRHLTGLTHIRGVPMVAASPVHYQDEHSSGAGNTPSLNATVGAPAGGNGGSGGGTGSGTGSLDPDSPQQIQQQQQQRRPSATVQSPPQSNQPIDIHAYQPPWKGLVEYAQQTPETPQQPDRLNASSPRYQQLIGQIHGYGASSVACDHQVGSELHPAQQQQQQQQYGGGPGAANVYSQSQPQPPPPPQPTQPPHHIQLQQQQQLIQQQQQQQHLHHHHHHHNQSNNHLHHNHLHHHHQPQQQHLAQVAAPMAGHHANQFQH